MQDRIRSSGRSRVNILLWGTRACSSTINWVLMVLGRGLQLLSLLMLGRYIFNQSFQVRVQKHWAIVTIGKRVLLEMVRGWRIYFCTIDSGPGRAKDSCSIPWTPLINLSLRPVWHRSLLKTISRLVKGFVIIGHNWERLSSVSLVRLFKLIGLPTHNDKWLFREMFCLDISQAKIAWILTYFGGVLDRLDKWLALVMGVTYVIMSRPIGGLPWRWRRRLLLMLVGFKALLSLQNLRAGMPLIYGRIYVDVLRSFVGKEAQRLSLWGLWNYSESSTSILGTTPVERDYRRWDFILFRFIFSTRSLIWDWGFFIAKGRGTLVICCGLRCHAILLLAACHSRVDITWAWSRNVARCFDADRRMWMSLVMTTRANLRVGILQDAKLSRAHLALLLAEFAWGYGGWTYGFWILINKVFYLDIGQLSWRTGRSLLDHPAVPRPSIIRPSEWTIEGASHIVILYSHWFTCSAKT